MKLKVKDFKYSLNESGQGTTEIRFALVNPETEETITPFCKCKDYFSDIFWSNATGKDVNIYGFFWKPNEDGGVLDKDRIMVALSLKQRWGTGAVIDPTEEEAKNIVNYLNKFEENLKFSLSTATLCDDKKYIILEFSKDWTKIPYLVSAFFMFIRLGFKYTDNSIDPITFYKDKPIDIFVSPADAGYFEKVENKIKDLYAGKIDKNQKYSDYENNNTIHGHAGILGYKEYKIN